LHSVGTGLLSTTSALARRVAFPLLLLGAGLVLVQPCAGASGVFEETGRLGAGRQLHTATLLPNGKVLVAGGSTSFPGGSFLASAELYDPASGTWMATGSLAMGRAVHTATVAAQR
jgi:Kelch motif